MTRLKLKENFPELQYICTVLNRLTIQGNRTTVELSHSMDGYYVHIGVRRCRKYSYVSVQRPLAEINAEAKIEIAKISADDILLFDTNKDGSYIDIHVYQTYNEVPSQELLGIPSLVIPSLDKETETLSIKCLFTLRKNFYELESLADIFNLMIARDYFSLMSLKENRHLEISLFGPKDSQSTLSVGFGLWVPKKNSKVYSSWDPKYYQKSVESFNRLSSRLTFRGKFYFLHSNRPSLEFRAILEQSES